MISQRVRDSVLTAIDRSKNARDIKAQAPRDIRAEMEKPLGSLPTAELPPTFEPGALRDAMLGFGSRIQDLLTPKAGPVPESLTRAAPSSEGSLTFASPFVSQEAADLAKQEVGDAFKKEDKLVDTKFGKATVNQALGIDLAGTALQTIGGLKSIDAQEEDRLGEIAQQHDLDMENLRSNSNLRNLARQSAVTQTLIGRMKQLDRLTDAGGVQRQQFLDNV